VDDSAVSADRVRAGDARATARLISMIEREDPSRLAVLKALHAYGGKAHVVGITGPPGAGKSTLTDKLVGDLRGRGRKVAVIAVDPSSPFTGGAILGDRIRMQRHATDAGWLDVTCNPKPSVCGGRSPKKVFSAVSVALECCCRCLVPCGRR